MRFIQSLDLTETEHRTHGLLYEHGEGDVPLVRDIKISKLLKKLEETGVLIDLKDSEQTGRYLCCGESKTTTVPLHTRFPEGVELIGYDLRNVSWGIYLRDYEKSYSTDEFPRDGGDSLYKRGIVVEIRHEGMVSEGEVVQRVQNTICQVISPKRQIFS